MMNGFFIDGKAKAGSEDYCTCKQCSSVTSRAEEFGYRDVCCDCGKPLEDGFHYYNHYDGEDHDDIGW